MKPAFCCLAVPARASPEHAAWSPATAGLPADSTAVRASRIHALTRKLPEDRDAPYRYGNATHAATAGLLDSYRAACLASDRTARKLDALAVTLRRGRQSWQAACRTDALPQ